VRVNHTTRRACAKTKKTDIRFAFFCWLEAVRWRGVKCKGHVQVSSSRRAAFLGRPPLLVAWWLDDPPIPHPSPKFVGRPPIPRLVGGCALLPNQADLLSGKTGHAVVAEKDGVLAVATGVRAACVAEMLQAAAAPEGTVTPILARGRLSDKGTDKGTEMAAVVRLTAILQQLECVAVGRGAVMLHVYRWEPGGVWTLVSSMEDTAAPAGESSRRMVADVGPGDVILLASEGVKATLAPADITPDLQPVEAEPGTSWVPMRAIDQIEQIAQLIAAQAFARSASSLPTEPIVYLVDGDKCVRQVKKTDIAPPTIAVPAVFTP
jgi:hypothetical protein